jgi:hypothetical protein
MLSLRNLKRVMPLDSSSEMSVRVSTCITKISNIYYGNMATFKYMLTTETNENYGYIEFRQCF